MDEVEQLREENKRLKLTIQQLRKELLAYRTRDKRRYNQDRDHVPYHEDEDRQ